MTLNQHILTTSIAAALMFGAVPLAFGSASHAVKPAASRQTAQKGARTTTSARTASNTPTAALQTKQKLGSKTSPQQLQAVTVTGSMIRQVGLATREPIITISKQQMESTGKVTLSSILSQLTINGGDTNANRQGILVEGGPTTGVDLRGLGPQRTLVLVNGRRWVQQLGGGVDISSIPSSIVSRIEVLKDGASALYGSDAIGGVVNIITKKHFNGISLNAYYGMEGHTDGKVQKYSVTIGKSTHKASLLFNVSYTNKGVMWDRTRAITSYPHGVHHPHDGYNNISGKGQFCILGDNGACGPTYVLNRVGDNPLNLSNYHLLTGSYKDKFNRESTNPFRNPLRKKSVYVQGAYRFTPNLKFHSSAMYTHYQVRVDGNPATIAWTQFATNAFNNQNIPMSADSIYNPTNQPVGNPSRRPVGFEIRTMGHPSLAIFHSSSEHFNAGLSGNFTFNENPINWNTWYNYNHAKSGRNISGAYNYLRVKNTIGPSFINGSGVPQCGVPGDPIVGCTPWNLLGGTATMSPAVAKYIFVTLRDHQYNTQNDFGADISGNIAYVPFGGPIGLGFGVQRRVLRGRSVPDNLVQAGLFGGNSVAPASGSYAVNSVYGELSVDAINDMPGVQDLSFDVAARHSHYNTFGGTTNAKYSFKYQPIRDVVIRGVYSQAFRSPSISELFSGELSTHPVFLDPCDASFGATVYGATVHNACVAQLQSMGIANAASFRQLNRSGLPISSGEGAKPVHSFTTGSNPNLRPETAIERNLGIIYSPHQLSGFNATLNWYSVDIENVIAAPTADNILQWTYQGESRFHSLFTRNPVTGQINNVNFQEVNAGKEQTKGYDLQLSYIFSLGSIGRFKVTSTTNYVSRFRVKRGGSLVWQSLNGTYQPQDSFWRVRSNASLTWKKGHFAVTWRARYFSGLLEPCLYFGTAECNRANYASAALGHAPMKRTGAVTFNDFRVSYNTPWKSTITLGINNAFKKSLPVQYAAGSRNAPVNFAYDVDRFMYVDFRQEF